MVKIAVYGSLRKGHYNYEDDAKVLETTRLYGYALFRNIHRTYPVMVKSLREDDSVVLEVQEIPETQKEWIDWMERGAGYKPVPFKDDIEMYVFREPYENLINNPEYIKIDSGDWSQHFKG